MTLKQIIDGWLNRREQSSIEARTHIKDHPLTGWEKDAAIFKSMIDNLPFPEQGACITTIDRIRKILDQEPPGIPRRLALAFLQAEEEVKAEEASPRRH
jgi:hypothetical protein